MLTRQNIQKRQVELQWLQCDSVKSSLRESPVARIDKPPVRIAPVAFAPLMPVFFVTLRVVTLPLV